MMWLMEEVLYAEEKKQQHLDRIHDVNHSELDTARR